MCVHVCLQMELISPIQRCGQINTIFRTCIMIRAAKRPNEYTRTLSAVHINNDTPSDKTVMNPIRSKAENIFVVGWAFVRRELAST